MRTEDELVIILHEVSDVLRVFKSILLLSISVMIIPKHSYLCYLIHLIVISASVEDSWEVKS